MAVELAKAYVQIIPSASGIENSISDIMNGESRKAGESSGKNFMSGFGGVAKKALVGLGIGKMVKDAIGDASAFETAMAKTSTLFSGTDAEFTALKGTVLDLSSSYGIAATTLAEAAYSAESAGVSMENLGPMLESSSRLAMAGFTDVDTALSATAKTMNAYGDAAMSIEDIQKVLIQTQNLGITTVGELGASLANVTPTAAAMGVSFDQVGAAMAQMTAQGVPTAQATTQLRSAMSELGKEGSKADKAFRQAAKGTEYANMGFKEAIAKGANLGDVFGMMQKYADKSGKSMVDLWGSVEAGNAAMMIASDVDKFNENMEQMATDADVVGEAYSKMSDTFGTSMNKLKESAKNFFTTLFNGGDISTAFNNLLGSLGDVGSKLTTWLTTGLSTLGKNLPNMMASLVDFGAGIIESLANVDWIELGTTIINGIIGGLGALGKKLLELVKTAITKVVKGDVDFGAIGNAIWGGITSILDTAGEWLSSLLSTAVELVTGDTIDFGSIGSAILGGVTSFLDNAGTFLSNLFVTGKDAVTDGSTIKWDEVGQSILNGVTSAIDTAGKFLEGAFTAGKALIETINWENLGTVIGNGVNETIDLAGKFLESCFTAGKSLIEKIDWDNLGKVIGDGVNNTIDLAGKFLEGCFTAGKSLIEKIDWDNLGKVIGDGVNNTIDLAGKFLEGCFSAGKELVEAIDWDGIGTVIGDGVNSTIDLAGKFLEGCFSAGKTLVEGINWDNIGTVIGDGINSAIDLAGLFLETPFKAAKGLVEGIDWNTLGTTISKGVTGTIDAAGNFLKVPFEAAKDLIVGIPWSEVGSAISDGLGDVWSGLTGFFGGVLGGAGDAVSGLGQGLGDVFSGAGEAINNLLTGNDSKQAAEQLKQTMADLNKALDDGKKTIKETAKAIGSDIKTSIETELSKTNVEAIGESVITNITAGVSDNEKNLYEHLKTVGQTGAKDFSKTITWQSTGQSVINSIRIGIAAIKSTLKKDMIALRDSCTDSFKTASVWTAAGESAMNSLNSGIGKKESVLTGRIGTIANNMILAFSGKDWAGAGTKAMNGIYSAVNGTTKIEGAMDDHAKACVTAFSSVKWNTLGSNIVAGIVAGVKAAASNLKSTMTSLAKDALSAAKKELGIESPSRVMRDMIGINIDKGIAAGIASGQDIVTDAMNDMTTSMLAPGVTGSLAYTGNQLGAMAVPDSYTDSNNGNLYNIITEAVSQALDRADLSLYMDGYKVGARVNQYLGRELSARRFK